MPTPRETVIDLEKRFWQSMVDSDTDAALEMLAEPSVLVSEHGTMKFDHDTYRRMAESGDYVLKSFELRDVDVTFPNENTAIATYRVKQASARRGDPKPTTQEMADSSTWIRKDGEWRCAMHTETPLTETPMGKS
jgi:hypothetical protein